jgi:hypothetical protein
LLLPSFLATDRWPTLPRVLGVIPGVYFYPAVGLLCVAGAAAKALQLNERIGPAGGQESSPSPLRAALLLRLRMLATPLLCTLALLAHADATFRDYFPTWGRSQATFDAFEGDMAAAASWLRNNAPAGHVYLSSDIYRHPTFMLLAEQATVQTYFQHRNPNLSWFDARSALPLPPPGESATYLIGSGAPLAEQAAMLLGNAPERDRVPAPNGSPALTVIELPQDVRPSLQGITVNTAITFTDQLALIGAGLARNREGALWLTLAWRTAGPDLAGWQGYRLEVAGRRPEGDPWQDDVPFEVFRASEWTPGGSFVSWHKLDVPDAALLGDLRLRLLHTEERRPIGAADAADGWHAVPLR